MSNNIDFGGFMDGAICGAELAAALAGSGERGRIYVVEPLGPFEDDPNLIASRRPGPNVEQGRFERRSLL